MTVWDADPTEDRAKIEWTIHAAPGTTINITARHERAGTMRRQIELR